MGLDFTIDYLNDLKLSEVCAETSSKFHNNEVVFGLKLKQSL